MDCHNAYCRQWNKTRRMSPEQRKRDACRSHAGVYKRRGLLVPQPCAVCGSGDQIEMHHEDYDKPLEVIWLCRPHHRALTNEVAALAATPRRASHGKAA